MPTTHIASIHNGIIFLMAEWSGQSKWAYKHLATYLEKQGISIETLASIDIDRKPYIADLPELAGKIHGFGEAAVVKDGRIVFVTVLGKDKELADERCEELLRVYKR
jgi:hypothetical protein